MVKRKSGFTLLELMIVVIIIGILASLAIPRFIKATLRARSAEALTALGMIRGAEWRYYTQYDQGFTATIGLLDVDDPNNTPNAKFAYDIQSATATTLLIRARYDPTGSSPSSTDYITIDEDGDFLRYGSF